MKMQRSAAASDDLTLWWRGSKLRFCRAMRQQQTAGAAQRGFEQQLLAGAFELRWLPALRTESGARRDLARRRCKRAWPPRFHTVGDVC